MTARKTMPAVDRFWAKVRRGVADECWEWTGAKNSQGYGQLRVDGKVVYAHRFALELSGFSIPDGHHACHTCDNRPCCNPTHLFAGTANDNTQDMIRKGRDRKTRGEQRENAVLTDEAVRQIRMSSLNNCELGRRFGVSNVTILKIRRGEKWKHVVGLGHAFIPAPFYENKCDAILDDRGRQRTCTRPRAEHAT